MQLCLRGAFARISFFANHVLTWWSEEELWAGLLSMSGEYTLTQQRWRGPGGCLVARGIMMTLCVGRERKRQEPGSVSCERADGLMTFPACVFAQWHLVWFEVPLLFFKRGAVTAQLLCCTMLFSAQPEPEVARCDNLPQMLWSDQLDVFPSIWSAFSRRNPVPGGCMPE